MFGESEDAEYLAEVRKHVCGGCPERGPAPSHSGLSCACCGVKVQLYELIECVHEAGDGQSEFDPVQGRFVVCARCAFLGSDTCPCPGGRQSAQLMDAVHSADERRRQWELVRRSAARQTRQPRVPIREMIEAYEAATGTCVGCD